MRWKQQLTLSTVFIPSLYTCRVGSGRVGLVYSLTPHSVSLNHQHPVKNCFWVLLWRSHRSVQWFRLWVCLRNRFSWFQVHLWWLSVWFNGSVRVEQLMFCSVWWMLLDPAWVKRLDDFRFGCFSLFEYKTCFVDTMASTVRVLINRTLTDDAELCVSGWWVTWTNTCPRRRSRTDSWTLRLHVLTVSVPSPLPSNYSVTWRPSTVTTSPQVCNTRAHTHTHTHTHTNTHTHTLF